MRILISSGATREMIDDIRFISNISSGKTGAFLADYFLSKNHEVYYLHGVSAHLPKGKSLNVEYVSFAELDEKFRILLREMEFDAVIHAAAVSDYRIENIFINGLKVDQVSKIASNQKVSLELTSNYKIIGKLKEYAHYPFTLFGFKLTSDTMESNEIQSVKKLFNESKPDYVIHNKFHELTTKLHPYKVYGDSGDKVLASGKTKQEMADSILSLMERKK